MKLRYSIVLLFLMLVAGIDADAQHRLSEKLRSGYQAIDFQNVILSVSVRDTSIFCQQYANARNIIMGRQGNVYRIRVSNKARFDSLVTDQNVKFLDAPSRPTPDGGSDYVNLAINRITTLHHFFPTLDGGTQYICIKERSVDANDLDVRGRLFSTVLSTTQASQHATTMATLAAGAGNSSWRGYGVAPSAGITTTDFDNLLPDNTTVLLDNELWVQNHSYGVGIENYYGNEAVAYDDQVFGHPQLLHVFSSGNLGEQSPTTGQYAGLPYANLSGTFKQAKNVLVVTALDTTLQCNARNSRGPAYDGRLKPELTAFGQEGTSEAAALVSGVSVLLQEQYQQLEGQVATSDQLKACLIAGADDAGKEGIDYTYGYGVVNAFRSAQIIDRQQFLRLEMGSDEVSEVSITVPSSIAQLRIAVVWNDPPAAPDASTALMHDLDSWLEGGGNTFLPWVLDSEPEEAALSSFPLRKKDALNNIEYFTVDGPEVGAYILSIQTPMLTTVSQHVAIAWWFEPERYFSWDYPTTDDVLQSDRSAWLMWGKNGFDNGVLSYRLNAGEWTLIDDNASLDEPYRWRTPDTLAVAQLRVVTDNNEFVSDEFVISPELRLTTLFNCSDSVAFAWEDLPNADGYLFSALGDLVLEPVATSDDSVLVQQKEIDKYNFSVTPLINGKHGLQSRTIDYRTQVASCFINFFSASRLSKDSVSVELVLSTLYAVHEVRIYRTIDGVRELVYAGTPDNVVLEWFDTSLSFGYVTYDAEVSIENNAIAYAEPSTLLIENANRAVLFPNPLPSGSDINVLSEGEGLIIRVYDPAGKLLLEEALQFREDYISTSELSQGLYLYSLYRGKTRIDSGRFVVI